MRGEKQNPYAIDWTLHKDWSWANTEYTFTIDRQKEDIEVIVIDPSNLMADVDKNDNYYVAPEN